VIVQNLNAFFVVSKMSKIRRATWLVPSAHDFVECVLNKIGLPCGASTPYTSTPYPGHALYDWVIDTFVSRRIALKMNLDMHVDIRRRALRRRDREAAVAEKEE